MLPYFYAFFTRQESVINRLFKEGPSIGLRIFAVIILAVSLLVLDTQTSYLQPLKSYLIDAGKPLYGLADMPNRLLKFGSDRAMTKDGLLVKNAQLEAEGLVLRAKVQKLASLTIENVRLRELLNASAPVKERLLLAEVVAVSPNPLLHYVMIDKGSDSGVYEGQAVVDAYGLFGQVMEVSAHSSRVLLISDQRHAVPVQVDRTGARLITEGMNDFVELSIPNVALTSDIVKGDVLSTSGLGEVFPVGYPLGRVADVVHDAGLPFAIITVKPFAHLDRARHVLLLFPERQHEG